MKINTKVGMYNEFGEDLVREGHTEKRTIGDVAAQLMMVSESDDKLRSFELGLKLRNSKGDIDLSKSDYKFIKDHLEKSKSFPLYAGQILYHLEAEEKHPRNAEKSEDDEVEPEAEKAARGKKK